MEPPMKLFDMFEMYDGTSDVAVRIQRTKVIAEIQNLKLELLFPILLRKAAYSLYDALTVKDKKDGIEVERVLLAAFSVDAYTYLLYFDTMLRKILWCVTTANA